MNHLCTLGMSLLFALSTTVLSAQNPAPFAPLQFLIGTWDAQTTSTGAGAKSAGTYTFQLELNGHILARHSRTADCKAPSSFDCDHGDLLYVFTDHPGAPLQAIYFDNEGHVLHYTVTTPTADSALFLSDPAQPGPQFRLTYERKGATMTGKFQMHLPGQAEWKSYLEWSGTRK